MLMKLKRIIGNSKILLKIKFRTRQEKKVMEYILPNELIMGCKQI